MCIRRGIIFLQSVRPNCVATTHDALNEQRLCNQNFNIQARPVLKLTTLNCGDCGSFAMWRSSCRLDSCPFKTYGIIKGTRGIVVSAVQDVCNMRLECTTALLNGLDRPGTTRSFASGIRARSLHTAEKLSYATCTSYITAVLRVPLRQMFAQ